MNHYSKMFIYIYIPCWSRSTTQNIALSGIRMHIIRLFKCILFHTYLCRVYVISRRHDVETPSTLLALCEGNHLRPMDSPRNRPLWRNFGGLSWTNFWKQNSPVVGDLSVMICDAMTPHDVTEIYHLIHILRMWIELLPHAHMKSIDTVHIRAP